MSRPDAGFSLTDARTGAVVAVNVEAAFDSHTRRRGLLGRDSLADGTALVIAPSNAVHSFFMRFAIDVLFVRRDGEILKVRAALPANRIAVCLRAFAVIEMPAGAVARAGVRRGDRLAIQDRSPSLPGI